MVRSYVLEFDCECLVCKEDTKDLSKKVRSVLNIPLCSWIGPLYYWAHSQIKLGF